jgi:hypothetical protein
MAALAPGEEGPERESPTVETATTARAGAVLESAAAAQASQRGLVPDEIAKPALGSGGVTLPVPAPAEAPTAGPPVAPLPEPPARQEALAAGPSGTVPPDMPEAAPLPAPTTVAGTTEADVPAEEGGAAAALELAVEPEAAPEAPAILSLTYLPKLKNASMLGIAPLPKLVLELPLARIEEVTQRLAPQALEGSAGGDSLWGGAGNDLLSGGGGDDLLFGGYGADTLAGGEGDDVLLFTGGAQMLRGGPGRDLFVFGLPDLLQPGSAAIADFEPGVDALLALDVGNRTFGYGALSWGSRIMTIDFLMGLYTPGRFEVSVAYPPRQYWEIPVEGPRVKDLWMVLSESAQIVRADPSDPAEVIIITRDTHTPPPATAASELHLL